MLNKLNKRWCKFMNQGPALGREGFTLVEILMVLMILSVGILPIAVIQHRARQEVSEADRYTKGITIASAQLERIKGMGFGIAAADSGAAGHVNWVANINNVGFGLDRIVVTASWRNGDAVESLTVTDLMSMR
jgi:prepilin-type N-terminal cleavage/methylation domain-containing protein